MVILGNLPSKSRTNHEFQWRQHAARQMKWQLLHLMAFPFLLSSECHCIAMAGLIVVFLFLKLLLLPLSLWFLDYFFFFFCHPCSFFPGSYCDCHSCSHRSPPPLNAVLLSLPLSSSLMSPLSTVFHNAIPVTVILFLMLSVVVLVVAILVIVGRCLLLVLSLLMFMLLSLFLLLSSAG